MAEKVILPDGTIVIKVDPAIAILSSPVGNDTNKVVAVKADQDEGVKDDG